MKCGLLGRKLGHSYSPQIHACLGGYSYELFEKEPEELEDFLKNGDFTGINVTIPYKKDVIPYLDTLTPTAERLGAVNTIVRRGGKLIGHNTDYFGFTQMLDTLPMKLHGKKVLVLGSGGASNTVVAVLKDRGAEVVVISRTGIDNYENLHLHKDAILIVNTTPVGMYPNTGVSPIDLKLFPCLQGVLDLIYNPARTQLLLDAEKMALPAKNGLQMLVAQAKESAEWFLIATIPNEVIGKIHSRLEAAMQNVVLVGMPGCGKSTVARLLGERLGKEVVDADAEIEKYAHCTIPEIFARGGETEFRAIETQILGQLGKRSGLVIATGGGCVTREENYPLLHQNGTIVWLQRDLSALSTDGRPLSAAQKMEDMYRVRKGMYEQFADYTVQNNGAPEKTAESIEKLLK